MDGGDSIFDSIFDEENLEGVEDVEMLDAEEGELVEQSLKTEVRQNSGVDVNLTTQESKDKSRRPRNKKKNKRKKGNSGSNITDVNRFVVDVCKHLKERKSYLVWTAVGCLGMSAFSDLVKEVEAIQACGGQKTADGRRYRTGGGILWGILKVRDPNAYKEIMKKGNEFEKQFKQHNVMQPQTQNKSISQGISLASTDQSADSNASSSQLIADVLNQPEQQSFVEQKRSSVHDRIRVRLHMMTCLELGIRKMNQVEVEFDAYLCGFGGFENIYASSFLVTRLLCSIIFVENRCRYIYLLERQYV